MNIFKRHVHKPAFGFHSSLLLFLGAVLCSCWSLAVAPTEANQQHAEPIINGSSVGSGTYPWMAALISKSSNALLAVSQRQFCGGSLIAADWVLTAAHCVDWQQAEKFQVLVGTDDLDGAGGQMLDVSEILVHPRYDHSTLLNDVALLRLAAPATAAPVALPSASLSGTLASQTATALGWGSSNGIKHPDCEVVFPQFAPLNQADFSCSTIAFRKQGLVRMLQSGQINILTNSECYTRFTAYIADRNSSIPADLSPEKPVQPGTLCAIDPLARVSACYGDSGGPLLAQVAGKPTIVGVTSFGIVSNCQGTYSLQFFTEVAQFIDFIKQAMSSSKVLDFSQLCPARSTPAIIMGAAVAGKSKVTIGWPAAAGAVGYTLLYVPLPRENDVTGSLELPAASTEMSISLPSGAHYLVAIQVKGKDCDSSVSNAVEVAVP